MNAAWWCFYRPMTLGKLQDNVTLLVIFFISQQYSKSKVNIKYPCVTPILLWEYPSSCFQVIWPLKCEFCCRKCKIIHIYRTMHWYMYIDNGIDCFWFRSWVNNGWIMTVPFFLLKTWEVYCSQNRSSLCFWLIVVNEINENVIEYGYFVHVAYLLYR